MIQHGAPTMTLTPELIEAAAKLCGWERHNPGSWFIVQWNDNNNIMAGLTTEAHLFPDGLLALEDALGDAGWVWDKVGDEGGTLCYRWRQYYLDSEGYRSLSRYRMQPDRATAACLAARAELEGK